jgi:hypothetical protein
MADPLSSPQSLSEDRDPDFRTAPLRWGLIGAAAAVAIAFGLTLKPAPKERGNPDKSATPSVGEEATCTLVLPRGDVQAAPLTGNAPLALRVHSVQAGESQNFSYSISYLGFEKGTFNLTDYLCTPNGDRLRAPIASVQINSHIPENAQYAIRGLPVLRLAKPFPYTRWLLVSAVLWLGAGLWMFLPRRNQQTVLPPPEPKPPELPDIGNRSLGEFLKPLLEKTATKTLTRGEKEQMEQVLLVYWGALLQLDHLAKAEQMRRILEHPEAGEVLRTAEQWLYQPDSKIPQEEINRLLKPYANQFITGPMAPIEEEPEAPAFQS